MRPIFSPTDFVQIKGRGTRTFTFNYKDRNPNGEMETVKEEKEAYKVFDFFANFEYFETEFDYDEELKVTLESTGTNNGGVQIYTDEYKTSKEDPLKALKVKMPDGDFWKIDLMYWGQFKETVTSVDIVKQLVEEGNIASAEAYVREHIFDKPEEYFNLEKLRKSVQVDRRLTLRELLERAFDLIPHFKSKAEKLDEECDKFVSIYKPNPEQVMYVRNFLKAYITDEGVREIVESKEYGQLATSPIRDDFKALEPEWREQIPLYVKDYVSLNEYK
jgi:type I restriction enzyme R subunit